MDIIDTVRRFDAWVNVALYWKEEGNGPQLREALDFIEYNLCLISKVEYLTEA